MPKIYVGSYTTCNDFDAQMTGGYDTVADMAMGCVACAGTDRDRVLAKLKEMITAEALEFEELTPDDELTYDSVVQVGTTTQSIDVSIGADPYAVMIIQEMEEA